MKQILIVAAVAALLFSAGANAQTFRLCSGEYWEPWKGQCPASEAYAYCYTAEKEALRICREKGASGKPLMVKMRDVPGNKCGYAEWDVTCQGKEGAVVSPSTEGRLAKFETQIVPQLPPRHSHMVAASAAEPGMWRRLIMAGQSE